MTLLNTLYMCEHYPMGASEPCPSCWSPSTYHQSITTCKHYPFGRPMLTGCQACSAELFGLTLKTGDSPSSYKDGLTRCAICDGNLGYMPAGAMTVTRNNDSSMHSYCYHIDAFNRLLKEHLDLQTAMDFVVEHFVGTGKCFTLPNGKCVGVDCMHTPKG